MLNDFQGVKEGSLRSHAILFHWKFQASQILSQLKNPMILYDLVSSSVSRRPRCFPRQQLRNGYLATSASYVTCLRVSQVESLTLDKFQRSKSHQISRSRRFNKNPFPDHLNTSYSLVMTNIFMENHHFSMGKSTISTGPFSSSLCKRLPFRVICSTSRISC